MASDPSPSAVTRTVSLPASANDVWDAIADPSVLGDWLGGSVSVSISTGSSGTVSLADGERSVLVTRVDEGRELSMLWWRESDGELSSVSFEIGPSVEGAVLTVTERLLVAPARLPAIEARWGGVVLDLACA